MDELFKINPISGDIKISWYLWQIEDIQKLWKSYDKNKLDAARLIQYALNMSDISPFNIYRNVSKQQRAALLQDNLWGMRNPRADKEDITKIISRLDNLFKMSTAYNRVIVAKMAVAKMHGFISEFSADKENTEAWKDFSAIAKSLSANENDLEAAEMRLYEVLKVASSTDNAPKTVTYYD